MRVVSPRGASGDVHHLGEVFQALPAGAAARVASALGHTNAAGQAGAMWLMPAKAGGLAALALPVSRRGPPNELLGQHLPRHFRFAQLSPHLAAAAPRSATVSAAAPGGSSRAAAGSASPAADLASNGASCATAIVAAASGAASAAADASAASGGAGAVGPAGGVRA